MNLGHLDFEIVSPVPECRRQGDFDTCPEQGRRIRISDFKLPDNSLPNMMIPSKTNNHLSLINNHLAFGPSTTVEKPLQISSFMQNKANFPDDQMNVNKVLTMDYENKTLGGSGKKQSQTNPNKANFKKAKMNVTSIITKGYENKPPIRAPKKQSQTSKRQKPMQTSLSQRIMKKTAISGSNKTNQNKPNLQLQSPIFTGHSLINRMNQICCLCCFSVSFDSAKMALYTDNWNLKKDGKKKLNFLKCKRLNSH